MAESSRQTHIYEEVRGKDDISHGPRSFFLQWGMGVENN